jgi:thiamine biosynthesis lipoprotein
VSTHTTITRRQFLRIVATGSIAGWAIKAGSDAQPKSNTINETRLLMGTIVNLTLIAPDLATGRKAAHACFQHMTKLEHLLSRFDAISEVSQLNRRGELRNVSPALLELLQFARQVSEQSAGAFDITVKPLLDIYSAAPKGNLPTAAAIHQARALVDYRQVNVEGTAVWLGKKNMGLTLDGIAKGYIIDEAVAVLNHYGFTDTLVEAGGDLLAIGKAPREQGWRIGVESPRQKKKELLTYITVHNQAIATSGDYQQSFSPDFLHNHILNPHTGYSSPELASATVIAPKAWLADALATAVMVLGPQQGISFLEHVPDCQGYLVSKEMGVYQTPGFNR